MMMMMMMIMIMMMKTAPRSYKIEIKIVDNLGLV